MKKYLSLAIVLFVLGSAFIYQWFRTDETVARLDARINKLNIELMRLNRVEKHGETAFEEEMVKEVSYVDGVLKRLPMIPDEYTFAEELIERFRQRNIEVKYYYSLWKKTDFYQHVDLLFDFNFQVYDEALFQEIFDSFDRLVHWAVSPQDQILIVSIYSFSFDFSPNVTSCSVATKTNFNYWPFNALVRDRIELASEKCRERNEREGFLRKIKHYENVRKYLKIASSILERLDPDWKSNVESKVEDNMNQPREKQ